MRYEDGSDAKEKAVAGRRSESKPGRVWRKATRGVKRRRIAKIDCNGREEGICVGGGRGRRKGDIDEEGT